MENREIVLLDLIKRALFGIDVYFPEDTDWDAVFAEASAQTVVALAAAAVPPQQAKKWSVPAAQSKAHYMRALYEQTGLVGLFAANGIQPVIIKGAAAAVYYPDPTLRTMGDIDVMVPEKDFEPAKALLDSNGYVFAGECKDGDERTYEKGGVEIELHLRFSDNKYGVEPMIAEGMKDAVVRTLNGRSFPMLPDPVNGIVILDHIRHHLAKGLGIRQLVDWTAYAYRALGDKEYEENFLPLIESANLVKFCETLTKACKMYLGLPDTLTWCDGADADAASELIGFVMQRGNFGRKDPDKGTPVHGVALKMKTDGFFKALREAGEKNFPACKRNRFLRPFAPVLQLFRYAGRGLAALFLGKNPVNDIKKANKEADFYRRIGL